MNDRAIPLPAVNTQPGTADSLAARRSRVAWVDRARGIGIILVVYGHALRGGFHDAADRPAWVEWQDRVIYSFHMPLFFVLAGLFIWPSLARRRGGFVKSKLVTIAYPYFLWSLIEGGLELALAPFVNSPITPRDLLLIPIQPIEQFWFLQALFFAQIIAWFCFPRRFVLLVAAVIGYAVATVTPGMVAVAVHPIMFGLLYVAVGIMVAEQLDRVGQARPCVIAAGVLAAGVFAVLLVSGGSSAPIGVAIALSGVAATICLAASVSSGRIGSLLAWLGCGSMAIFVMHTIASAGVRIILGRVGFAPGMIEVLAITTIAGLALPMLAWRLAEAFNLNPWLGLDRYQRFASGGLK